MISVILGFGGFAYAFYFVLTHHAEKFEGFFDLPAFVLLMVAPISVIFVSHNFVDFFKGIKVVATMGFQNQSTAMNNIVNQLTQLSSAVRQDGIGVLASYKDRVKDPLFREGLTLILNSFTIDEIKHNLIAKINNKQTQFEHAANLFESLGKLCPGMGLVGTIIGLVQMMTNLSDPAKLGAAMAVSLLATLYGLILGTVIYTPIAEKIKIHAEKSLQLDTLIMEGVVLLKDKKSSAHFQNVVRTYTSNATPQGSPAGRGGRGNGRAG